MPRGTVWMLSLTLLGAELNADGLRCGTRLVRTGDSETRVTRVCGPPDQKSKARIPLWLEGSERRLSVTQWIYERRGKRAMIVSIRDGRVVRIERG